MDFEKVKEENWDKIGATSHKEILVIIDGWLQCGQCELNEILKEKNIKLTKEEVKTISNHIAADIADRLVNLCIEKMVNDKYAIIKDRYKS